MSQVFSHYSGWVSGSKKVGTKNEYAVDVVLGLTTQGWVVGGGNLYRWTAEVGGLRGVTSLVVLSRFSLSSEN